MVLHGQVGRNISSSRNLIPDILDRLYIFASIIMDMNSVLF